jgi:hypothetical protein
MKCLFVHVPRCGGMSFYYFLQEIFSEKSSIRFGDSAAVTQFMASTDSFNDYACVSGHLPFRYFADRNCQIDRFTVAFVRDPVEREQSGYGNILKHRYDDHNEFVAFNLDLYWEKFPNMPELHNLQCEYFSESRNFKDAAKNILNHRICVFDIEDIPIVAEMIKGFSKLPYSPQRTNSSDRDTIKLNETELNAISLSCSEDVKLFSWVRENRQYFHNLLRNEIWRSYLLKEN